MKKNWVPACAGTSGSDCGDYSAACLAALPWAEIR